MAESGLARDIVIVDDNVDAATIMALMLRRLGHTVRVAHNGSQAIELCAGSPPEIVLMDIGMPVMDGHEACRQMRRSEWGRAIFIVALTGWGSDEDRQRSKESGFDRHLVKPITRDDLIAVITDPGVGANGKVG
jgi:CheY-like chemotaxis protein